MSDNDASKRIAADFHRLIKGDNGRERERATAILGAVFVERELEILLRGAFITSKVVDALFDARGALSSFSAKADMALALGLLRQEQHKDLNLIRKIRNEFAHGGSEASFSTSPVREWLHALSVLREHPRPTGNADWGDFQGAACIISVEIAAAASAAAARTTAR